LLVLTLIIGTRTTNNVPCDSARSTFFLLFKSIILFSVKAVNQKLDILNLATDR
jgi:hypothetical protein